MAARAVGAAGAWRFRDGRWQRVDRAELDALMADLASRVPGTVRVSGTVRDSDSGGPVADAEVVFASTAGESSVACDDKGHYQVDVRPGFYRAYARADGYVSVGSPPTERTPRQPDVTSIGAPRGELAPLVGLFRDQAGVDMQMRAGAEIVGTLFDETGRPVAAAVVRARDDDRREAGSRLVLGTDMDETALDGSFRLEVPAGRVSLEAFHEQYAGLAYSPDNSMYVAPGDRVRVDLTMTEGCIITGRVVDALGHPVSEGALEAWIGGVPPNDFAPVGQIDASGRFRYATTALRRITLRAWPWKSPPSAPQELDCSKPGRRDDLVFEVPSVEPDLEGAILAADGTPVANAFVDLFPLSLSGMAQQERADSAGNWSFFALPPGPYHLTAYVPGHGVAAQRVTVPESGVELLLSGTGALTGHARGIRDGSFTLVVERCKPLTDDGRLAEIDDVSMPPSTLLVPVENGEYRVEGLPACPMSIRAETPYRSEWLSTEVTAGDTTALDLDLRQPRSKHLFGVVATPERVPVADVSVVRVPDSGTSRHAGDFAITDHEGRYEIRAYSGDTLIFAGLSGQRTTVAVSWDDVPEERIDIELPAAAE